MQTTYTATIWTNVDDRRMVVTKSGIDPGQGVPVIGDVVDTEDLVLDWDGTYADRGYIRDDGSGPAPHGQPPILWDATARKHGYRLVAGAGWREDRDEYGLPIRTGQVEPVSDDMEVRELADAIRATNAGGTTEITDPDDYAARAHRLGYTAASYRRHVGGALTTRQAAEMADTTPERFRALVSDARRRHGVELQLPREQWPDARTPLYDAEKLREYLAQR